MFKKSRRRIVAVILSLLVVLLFGTFCVIYLASYADMTKENRSLLEQYVASYSLPGSQEDSQEMTELRNPLSGDSSTGSSSGSSAPLADEPPADDLPADDLPAVPDRSAGGRSARPGEPPMLELSTFYSVAVSKEGQVLKVDTADIAGFDEEALKDLALEILESEKEAGVRSSLIYRTEDKGEYLLVAFLDNSVMMESVETLINYTLIFGGIALLVIFFLARYLANRIVAPLEESYLRQRQFISDAGHELKTPVAVMNANIDLLSREIGENPWLANIQYENERMSALVIQLLELARAENVTPQMEQLDLSRLVFGETLPFETVAYENGLTLETQITDQICVSGNSVQLKQLTSILIDNAIRHSVRGSEVQVILRKEKNHAFLSVRNDGEEIPPEQLQRLFERFYRTDAARTGEDGHYGLGLAIAKAIAQAHKGTVDVRCGQGKVEFTVKLPVQKQV